MRNIIFVIVVILLFVFLPIPVKYKQPVECFVPPCPTGTWVTPFKFIMHNIQPDNYRWNY